MSLLDLFSSGDTKSLTMDEPHPSSLLDTGAQGVIGNRLFPGINQFFGSLTKHVLAVSGGTDIVGSPYNDALTGNRGDNLIVGSLYSNIPRIANTDPATRALFPFIAKPVRFNANGEAENWSFANIGAQDQGTLGSAPGIEGNNTSRYSLIQNEQTRKNFTVFATFDINDRIKAYSQNIYSTVETVLPRNGASGNAVTSAGSETSGILISINNPYLSATSQQLLRSSGAVNSANNFIMSRTNQDLLGDNPLWGKTDTSNLVNGLKGDFDLFGPAQRERAMRHNVYNKLIAKKKMQPEEAFRRLLIIDDEERILTALKSLFRNRYHVFATTDGHKALDFLQRYQMHVIISDQRMPIMTGVELLRQSRDISPRSVRILLTGYSDLASIVGSINDGEIYRFISKPWDNTELQTIIAEAVTIALELAETKAAAVELPSRTEAGVLVVDRDEELFRVVRELAGSQCPVVYAADLEAAIAAIQKQEIAVVITDVESGEDQLSAMLKLLNDAKTEDEAHPRYWAPFVVEDGLLITGQNPASSELVAEKLLARLNG